MTNVLDDGIDDDYNNYHIELSDSTMIPYYLLDDQENVVSISGDIIP